MIEVKFTSDPSKLAAYLRSIPNGVHTSLLSAMARITIGLQSYIVSQKLQGQVLHHRTGNLGRNVAQEVREDTHGITGIVGVGRTAYYGKVHEYGGSFMVREHVRTSKLGNQFSVRAHMATYPERSFMRTALAEKAVEIRAKIAEAVELGLHS
jgi:phage gpG-like protein